MSFSEVDDEQFGDVDEAEAGSKQHSADLPTSPKSSSSRAITRPVEPVDDEFIDLDDSPEPATDVTCHFGPPSEPRSDVVEKLYMKKQLRDNEVAYRRKEIEYLELQDCTFQPNIHLHQPEGNTAKFLRSQEIYEQRRQVRLEKLAKAKQQQINIAEKAAHTARPQLSPGTRAILTAAQDSRPLIDRLMSPGKTRELVPELSFSYHPLVSPKAQRLHRDSNRVYEALYADGAKTQTQTPAPKPPTYVGAKSEALLAKQLRRDFKQVCKTETVDFEAFKGVLYGLGLANELDGALIKQCWEQIAQDSVSASQLEAILVQVLLHSSSLSPEDPKSSLHGLFTQMHKARLTSPTRNHDSSDSHSHVPQIDPASKAMVHRTGFIGAQRKYEEQVKSKRQLQAVAAEKAIKEQCSFSPKVNLSRSAQKQRRMDPETEVPRYEALYQQGVQMREERRLLPAPDREYEKSKAELTFTPKRFSSSSPRRTEVRPKNYDEAVERLKRAFAQHEELVRRLALHT